jgi:hypothetical protein
MAAMASVVSLVPPVRGEQRCGGLAGRQADVGDVQGGDLGDAGTGVLTPR